MSTSPAARDDTNNDVRRTMTVTDPAGDKYVVTAVKRGLPLQEGTFTGSSIVDFILGSVFEAVLELRAAKKTQWKVAAGRSHWTGNSVAVKEFLPPGVDPADRMTELVERIASGRPLR